jgi:hypothetical protein
MPKSYRQDISGRIFGLGRDGKNYHLNPKILRRQSSESRKQGSETTTHKFKLVTVRRLEKQEPNAVEQLLKAQQDRLARIALSTGQPVPFPYKPVTNKSDLKTSFAVYVDEDIDSSKIPVYTFTSPDSRIKCFITANGSNQKEYSVHIAHIVSRDRNKDDSYTVNWRIVTIDSTADGQLRYFLLESQSPDLHKSFKDNFDIDSLHYIGGGGWTGLSIDNEDRIPVKGKVLGDASNYIATSNSWRAWGQKNTIATVSFSLTPSYSFTWCREKIVTSFRYRAASHKTDIAILQGDGVIEATRSYEYGLGITNRPPMPELDITPVVHEEYSNAIATYVGTLNSPEVPGLSQSPDYGTDVQRLAIKNYQQETNILRPSLSTSDQIKSITDSKAVRQDPCFNLVCCSSPEMATIIRIRPGVGQGSINHKYELKTTSGSRGFQYGEDYKLWWTYGKILAFYPTNDGRIYRRAKTLEARGLPSVFPTPDTLYDRGELRRSEFPNAVETTWPALANPPSGFYGIFSGDAKWDMEYNNPPIFGHEAVYYYHINPEPAEPDDTLEQVNGSFNDSVNDLNSLRGIYGQMQGGLGGEATSSLHIGPIRKASAAYDTITVLSPSPSQKADLGIKPEKFPVGFWETAIFDETVNANSGSSITYYDRKGTATRSYSS